MNDFRNKLRIHARTGIHCDAFKSKVDRTMGHSDRAVVFLDFDGVLHPVGVPAVDEEFRLIENPDLFVWRPILERLLAPYPVVGIIVSSDWRRLFDDATLIRLLGPLATRFVGVVESYGTSRSEEILAEVKLRGLNRWVALDDHPSVNAAQARDPRFIACGSATGLSAVDIQGTLSARLATLSVDGFDPLRV
ncbi:HAD domain-containing protein [Paraburkholderia caribensis]|nr:HAD domain-containing protein [Paraburkholderia caribensis]